MRSSESSHTATPVRTCRRQLHNLVGAAIALQPGYRARDVAPILARQACQALGARQAVASVAGVGDNPVEPFRAVAGDARVLSGDHLRLLERAEADESVGTVSLIDPATRAVVAVAAPIKDRGGRTLGALMVADGYAGGFSEDDLAVLAGLVHMASPTLDNVRLRGSVPAAAAHELVDLLAVVIGHASLLDAALPAGDDRREDVAAIAAAAGRAAGLSATLLSTSRNENFRIGEGPLQPAR